MKIRIDFLNKNSNSCIESDCILKRVKDKAVCIKIFVPKHCLSILLFQILP
ncbi:hypothetical protein HMPREF9554_01043 [Treponema phagedenis F0421]|nr:hypothetical protein HMPREF9554_01043 [Treponema phagedenis F0421]